MCTAWSFNRFAFPVECPLGVLNHLESFLSELVLHEFASTDSCWLEAAYWLLLLWHLLALNRHSLPDLLRLWLWYLNWWVTGFRDTFPGSTAFLPEVNHRTALLLDHASFNHPPISMHSTTSLLPQLLSSHIRQISGCLTRAPISINRGYPISNVIPSIDLHTLIQHWFCCACCSGLRPHLQLIGTTSYAPVALRRLLEPLSYSSMAKLALRRLPCKCEVLNRLMITLWHLKFVISLIIDPRVIKQVRIPIVNASVDVPRFHQRSWQLPVFKVSTLHKFALIEFKQDLGCRRSQASLLLCWALCQLLYQRWYLSCKVKLIFLLIGQAIILPSLILCFMQLPVEHHEMFSPWFGQYVLHAQVLPVAVIDHLTESGWQDPCDIPSNELCIFDKFVWWPSCVTLAAQLVHEFYSFMALLGQCRVWVWWSYWTHRFLLWDASRLRVRYARRLGVELDEVRLQTFVFHVCWVLPRHFSLERFVRSLQDWCLRALVLSQFLTLACKLLNYVFSVERLIWSVGQDLD